MRKPGKLTFHARAFIDYCEGASYKEIATKHGVKRTTVNNWVTDEKWQDRRRDREERLAAEREELIQKANSKVYARHQKEHEEQIRLILVNLKIASAVTAEEARKIYKLEPVNESRLENIRTVVSITQKTANVLSMLFPKSIMQLDEEQQEVCVSKEEK